MSDINVVENNVLQPKTIKCFICGNDFVFSPAEQKYFESKGFADPKSCPVCRKLRSVHVSHTCVDCNAVFTTSAYLEAVYKSKGLEPPTRCESCRAIKRAKKLESGVL